MSCRLSEYVVASKSYNFGVQFLNCRLPEYSDIPKVKPNFRELTGYFLSLKAIIGNYENVLIMKHEETINAYEKEYLRMWETIEGIMKRKGVETEKKLELQVELDEDWE